MKQKIIKKNKTFNQSYILSAMVQYWELHGRFNLSLYSEIIKAKMQKTNN
jgi:hypothetical protein